MAHQCININGLPVTPSRDAVLTIEQLACTLQWSVSTLERMDLPAVYSCPTCEKSSRRYIYGVVLDLLAERARNTR